MENTGSTPAQYSIVESSIDKESIEEDLTPTVIEPNGFSSKNSITPEVIAYIATSYEVPIEFVEDCWDSAKNWLLAKGKIMKDYKAFLTNWVKREKANWILKSKSSMGSRVRGGVADARTR